MSRHKDADERRVLTSGLAAGAAVCPVTLHDNQVVIAVVLEFCRLLQLRINVACMVHPVGRDFAACLPTPRKSMLMTCQGDAEMVFMCCLRVHRRLTVRQSL